MAAPVDDLTWADVPDRMDEWAVDCAAPSAALKKVAADVITRTPVGYYYMPLVGAVALCAPRASRADFLRCKSAASRAVGADNVIPGNLPVEDAASGLWVKVAYSPTVRRAGELLDFFPSTSGIPNAPSPLAAMLTTALVGGGLGYGAGRIGEAILPVEKGKLRRTMAVLGAGAGGLAAAPWAVANARTGEGLLSPKPLDGGPTPEGDPASFVGEKLGSMYVTAVDHFVKAAFEGMTFGNFAARQAPTPLDVNIDAMGRTLWDTGASPALAAATMSALYAARQMPDERAQAGVATGHQLGQLAVNAGKDYVTGALVGAALNKTLGLPVTANQAGMGNLILGLIGAAVPKLF
jgi:hypothetical protein